MATAAEDPERRNMELERRLGLRIKEIERAAAEGRLWELVGDVPPIDEQLRPYLDDNAHPAQRLARVARGEWVVEAIDAFAQWEAKARASPDEKGRLAAWLRECEQAGPPPANDVDEKGNLTARGPSGERIRFRRFESPGTHSPGYMFVLSIE